MKRHVVVLTLPLVLQLLLAAQQVSTIHKAAALRQAALPAPTSTTAYDPYFNEGRGYWERNRLIYVHPRDTRVDLYDKDTLRSSVKISIPNSRDVSLSDATVTEDGRLIVSGCYLPEKGQIRRFVGIANPDGRVSPMVDTGRFSPKQIDTCGGATVWAIGWVRTGPDLDREATDEPYHILREYRLADGKMVNSTIERTTFAPWSPPAFSGHDFPDLTMRCAGKLLGIYEGASDEWIEYDLARGELSRWQLPKQDHPWGEYDDDGKILPISYRRTRISGVAMLDSGDVYASFVRLVKDSPPMGIQVGLYRLKKTGDRGDWIAVPGTLGPDDLPGAFDQLNGTDGVHLVYSRFGEHTWSFSSAPQ
jgi:hypothetical protein